jgi:hypothetical protein
MFFRIGAALQMPDFGMRLIGCQVLSVRGKVDGQYLDS